MKEPHSRDETKPNAYQTDAWLKNSDSKKANNYREKLSKVFNQLYYSNPNAYNNNLDGCTYINIRPQFGYPKASVKFGDSLSYEEAFRDAKKNKMRGELTDGEIEEGKISFENVRKTIEYFKPQKIVCCGCFDNVAAILGLKQWKTTKKPQRYQNIDVYYVYHPAYSGF